MEHWKTTITAGNRCFHCGDWVAAGEHYQRALAEAQLLLEHWQDAEAVVAALVISHHNLADLYLVLGQREQAAEHLCSSHERLLQTMLDDRLAQPLRSAAMRHSQRTYTELLQFIGEYGACPRTDRLLGSLPGCTCTSGQVSRHYH